MPKFKPGNIVSRVILGDAWQDRNNTDYLYAEFESYLSESHPPAHFRTPSDVDDYNDGCSLISISTNATFDDEPGTGRTIDTHIYQPVGRWIERIAMRFTIASLSPARIAQYIEANNLFFLPSFNGSRTLHDAIAGVCSWERNGSMTVAGMKGLVKQTQSNSIHRSASALAALIRVSLSIFRKEIYANVFRVEPIFHLETLVRSHPDKEWFLLLVKLARETLIAVRNPTTKLFFDPVLGKEIRQLRPSPEAAQKLRQRLIRALEIHRISGFAALDDTVGEACAICAIAVSTCIDLYARGDAYIHILETVYFTVIFVLRSIHELADFARITANRHIYLVLRTIAYWMDAIMFRCLFASAHLQGRFNMDLLKADIAYRSLVLVDSEDSDIRHTLLPESLVRARYALWNKDMLPRRHREATKWDEEAPPIQSLIEVAKQRTRRLLGSFDELEREVLGCSSRANIPTSQFEIDADPHWFFLHDFADDWWNWWKSTLERAQKVQVSENELTEEFREARRIGLADDLLYPKKWAYYQLHRLSRHKWGQYLRSNMDWDWDIGSCMKRLFRLEKQSRVRPSATVRSPSTSNVDAGLCGIWEISQTGETQGSLPKEVRIVYKTETGETRVGHPANESLGHKINPVIAQKDSGSGKESFVGPGEQETDDTGSSSKEDEEFFDYENLLSEGTGGDLKGQVPSDFGFERFQREKTA